MNVNITIDLDARCDECRQEGRCQNGLCLRCTTKAMGTKPMKSATGRAVRERLRQMHSSSNSEREPRGSAPGAA